MVHNMLTDGGHDSFVQHFLHVFGECEVLLLSLMRRAKATEFAQGRVRARVLPIGRRIDGVWRLMRALIGFRPEVIFCGEMGVALLCTHLAAWMLRRPYVASCHNRLHRDGVDPLRRTLDRLTAHCLRRAAACICHGPYLARQLGELGVPRERIVEFDWPFHCFRAAAEAPPRQDLTDGGTRRVVAYLGRVEAEKGVFDLLDALEPRLLEAPALRLVFMGAGDALPELQARIADAGLHGRVLAMGAIPYNDVPPLLAQATFAVTPTRSTFPEGRPMANMEMLALGLPVVAPDYGPFPFAVEHGVNGLLFRPDSVEDLRAKLLSILDDPALFARLKAGARQTSERFARSTNDFSWALQQAQGLAGAPRMQPAN